MGFSRKLVVFVITVGVLVGLDSVFRNGIGDYQIAPYESRIIMLVGISIVAAVSLNLINGLTGQFSIGHAGFMAVGGYAAAYVTRYYGQSIAGAVGGNLSTDIWIGQFVLGVGLLVGALAAALAGLVVGIPSLRLKGDYLAIVTLGFGEIIRVAILNTPAVGGATGFTNVPPLSTFFSVFGMAVLTIVIVRNITNSTFGRALTAIREDEIAAEAMGINTTRYKVTAFVISSALAGTSGALFGHFFGNLLSPQTFNFVKSIEIIVMIVLGGIGSITGAVLGATVLTVLPEALRDLDQKFPGLRMVLYSLLLILLMIFRPQGLLGRREFGLDWIRRRSRKADPVALTDAADALAGTVERPAEDTHQPDPGGRDSK